VRPTQTQSVGHGSIVGWVPADAPALQDGAHLSIFTPETIMFGTITQEYNRIQSTVAFCLPKLTYSYAILRHLAHDSRRIRDEVPPDATFRTPLSEKPFRLEDVQEHRLLISYREQDTTIPLKRDQFETLYQRISDSPQPFDLDRLPADAEPYATIFSVHPRFGIDQREGVLKTPIHLLPPPRSSTPHSLSKTKTTKPSVRNPTSHSTRIRCS